MLIIVNSRKIRNTNKTEHLNRFMETMTKAYPNKNWGFLYLYCDENRNLSCDYDNCHLECIPLESAKQK